jgi:hypothetical protein
MNAGGYKIRDQNAMHFLACFVDSSPAKTWTTDLQTGGEYNRKTRAIWLFLSLFFPELRITACMQYG